MGKGAPWATARPPENIARVVEERMGSRLSGQASLLGDALRRVGTFLARGCPGGALSSSSRAKAS